MDRNCMIEASCYKCLEEIGKGAHGTVWKAVDQLTNKVYAIKKMNGRLSQYENHRNLAEVQCLQKLSPHENILALHDVILNNNNLYLVLEFMECDLFELMKRGRGRPFSEQAVRNFCFQILKGLLHLHNEGYCHRDLKPENLLVSGNIVKIADFGLAKNLLHELNEPLEPYVGTRPYRAPELLLESTQYDLAIDIWAMGVIMAELFTGYPLFSCPNRPVDQMNNICNVIGSPDEQTWPQGLALAASMDYNFPEKFMKVSSIRQLFSLIPSASAPAIDLINSFLSWDPKRRPTAIEALQHPFFYAIPRLFLLYPSKAIGYDGAQKPCHKMGTLKQLNPIGRRVEQQMRPSAYDNQYSIWERSYQIPRKSGNSFQYSIWEQSNENLQLYPFPCMGPKLFHR